MSKKQSGFGVLGYLLTLGILTVVGLTGWYVWHHNHTANSVASSTTQTKTTQISTPPPKVVSIDAIYDEYLNYDVGIGITYSKWVAGAAKCVGVAPKIDTLYVSTPVNVYADTANHTIYVAGSRHVTMKSHQIGPGTYQGYDSCVVNSTTLVDLVHPENSDSVYNRIVSAKFNYGKVNNAAGLDGFVSSYAPTGIVIDHSVTPTKNGNAYSYAFKWIGTQEDPPQARWYSLLYDPAKELAVFWVTPNTQAPSWMGMNKTGAYMDVKVPTAIIID